MKISLEMEEARSSGSEAEVICKMLHLDSSSCHSRKLESAHENEAWQGRDINFPGVPIK